MNTALPRLALALCVLALASCAIAPAKVRRIDDHGFAGSEAGLHRLLRTALSAPEEEERNHALGHFVERWHEKELGEEEVIDPPTSGRSPYRVVFLNEEGRCYPSSYFDEIHPASDFEVRKIAHHRRDGVGTPLTALRENRQEEQLERYYPPEAITRPVTAVVEKGRLVDSVREVTVRLLCPLANDTVRVDGRRQPLAGDFTHYGDQTLPLLRSVVLRGGFHLEGWREDWSRFWSKETRAYRDGATQSTLENMAHGVVAASDSNDLAGASRIPSILAALREEPLAVRIKAAREQTSMTHGDAATVDCAEFFTRAVDAIASGQTLAGALDAAAQADYGALDAAAALKSARDSVEGDPIKVGSAMGLTCHTPEAFPLTLFFLLKYADQPVEALVQNAMAGGDSSARGMLIGLVMGAVHGTDWMPRVWVDELTAGRELESLLQLLEPSPAPRPESVSIPHPDGHELMGVLDLPAAPPKAYALFAHCFTCGKNLRGATRLARLLAEEGIATLRFDFTGIGESEGDFAGTSFLSNVEDLRVAADWMRSQHQAPALLIGHSLGGAAVLAAAGDIPECRGVATIGAPSDPAHVTHLFEDSVETIRSAGKATVCLAGRKFTIGSRFLEDLGDLDHQEKIAKLGRDLLILHSPTDEVVSLEHAGRIYSAAKHPKSFHSLAGANHLLTKMDQADYAAGIIAAWASRFVAA
jgi:alpha/beta superfamily hydrolase/ADP-ribosylglycohydrolase